MASLFLAARNLATDKIRLGLTAIGTGLSVTLILLLSGFISGIDLQVSVYLDHEPGSIVVAQTGVSNLLGSSSRLPAGTLDRVIATPGVARAIPILSQFVILDLNRRKQPAYLVGYDPAKGGGPWQLVSGTEPADTSQIVVDQVLARRQRVAIGDTFAILGRAFKVSGLSGGTASFMTSYLFVRESALESLIASPEQPSFILVSPAAGMSAAGLITVLRSLPGATALAKQTMVANDRDLLARVFRLPLELMAIIAYAVGALVVGLVVYTATIERRREYGALKALGAANRLLYVTVTAQALVAAVSGALLGVALALAAAQLIMVAAPQLLVAVQPSAILLGVAAGLGMALVGSLLPARLIAGMAPAEVLRS